MIKVFVVACFIFTKLKLSHNLLLSCDDSYKYASRCPKWAELGECVSKHSGFMKRFCRKSCNECPSKCCFNSKAILLRIISL